MRETSALFTSNMIRSRWSPPPLRVGWMTTVADCWFTLGWCLPAVVRWICQSRSAKPSVSFAVGARTARIMFARSCFQKREMAFFVSSLPLTLRDMYRSRSSLSMLSETSSDRSRSVASTSWLNYSLCSEVLPWKRFVYRYSRSIVSISSAFSSAAAPRYRCNWLSFWNWERNLICDMPLRKARNILRSSSLASSRSIKPSIL